MNSFSLLRTARVVVLGMLFWDLAMGPAGVRAEEGPLDIGAAKVDITPAYPIRLSGYGGRRTEAEGAAQRLWAKALAVGVAGEVPAVLVTVDNCGISESMTREVADRLLRTVKLPRDRLAVCSTHTHTGPCVTGVLPNLFSQEIPVEQQRTIDRYTGELIDHLERVILAALADRRPGKLFWGEGRAFFARNRRTKDGPVDLALPLLQAVGEDGRTKALFLNYACHGTTLVGEMNQHHGDWLGCAQEYLERDHPGAVALVAAGAGADANPHPRGEVAHARRHGEEIAREVKRLISGGLTPVKAGVRSRAKTVELPFEKVRGAEEWRARAAQPGIVGHHARGMLRRLERGEVLPASLPYFIQTWVFGEALAMVFLPGEVVVDYSLRLKKEWDESRLWVNAYANDVPCYIPSRRILHEGGYEAEDSLWYYDRPARLAMETEELIHGTIAELLPSSFRADAKQGEFPPPKSPGDSLKAMRTKAGLRIELAAAEPLVVDPVAIDFGADGKLWVVEMRDFPQGMDGRWKPGGRVKMLEDVDGDGVFERGSLFLEEIPFPTGITAWREGVLICAAPDILYARDADGDGRADEVKKLFSGFATENYQARVNSLSLGLDHWFYGANGLIGGTIRSFAGDGAVDIRGRDFRMNPETGAFETAAGLTQQGRVRDDWGRWFGCDNSTLLWFYPWPDHYVRRNPYLPSPAARVPLVTEAEGHRLYPISRTLRRFNDPGHVNRVTSACGLGLYRDDWLGKEYEDNAFICEPVHNLVTRRILKPKGGGLSAARAEDEAEQEFLASTDNWFRPVQVRTGPDGALWVVDMYRFVVEHPRWITADRLAELDLRAGDDLGRIYRILPEGKKPRAARNLKGLNSEELALAVNTRNGVVRDLAHQELLWRGDEKARAGLRRLAAEAEAPAARVQALAILDGLKAAEEEVLRRALADPHFGVREQGLRMLEKRTWADAVRLGIGRLAADADARVRRQLAFSLGEWEDAEAGRLLARLAVVSLDEAWILGAVYSSAAAHAEALLEAFAGMPLGAERDAVLGQMAKVAAGCGRRTALLGAVAALFPGRGEEVKTEEWRFKAFGSLLSSLQAQGSGIWAEDLDKELGEARAKIEAVVRRGRELARDVSAGEAARAAAMGVLGYGAGREEDGALLRGLLVEALPLRLQAAALEALGRFGGVETASYLAANWGKFPPAIREQAKALLLGRPEWTAEMARGLELGLIQKAELSPSDRQALERHADGEVRARIAALFPSGVTPDKREALKRYAGLDPARGDEAKGAALFGQLCASCHRFRGVGNSVGPSLAALTDKSPGFLVAAIVDPNAAVEHRFVSYSVRVRDGRESAGIISGESAASVVVTSAAGVSETILRREIAEIRASNVSLMPEGFEQVLSRQDMADLILYLQRSPENFGNPPFEKAARARADFLGRATHEYELIFGSEQMVYPSWMGALRMPHCRQTNGKSRVIWEAWPRAGAGGESGVETFRFPVAMGFHSRSGGGFKLLINGEPAVDFDVSLESGSWMREDGKVRVLYSALQNNAEDSNGVLTVEARGGELAGGKRTRFEVVGSATERAGWFGLYLMD